MFIIDTAEYSRRIERTAARLSDRLANQGDTCGALLEALEEMYVGREECSAPGLAGQIAKYIDRAAGAPARGALRAGLRAGREVERRIASGCSRTPSA